MKFNASLSEDVRAKLQVLCTVVLYMLVLYALIIDIEISTTSMQALLACGNQHS